MSLEREIRKIMAESVGISEKIKTPQKLQRKMQLKKQTNFDFRLFDPEDSPGSDKANDDMNKEIVKASKMKDKGTAYRHMLKIQKKHSKHGATDTEPREMINAILDRVFGESVNFEENFEILNEMDPAKHVQKNDETGMYCVYNNDGEKVKEFKDKEDAIKYATDNHDELMEKLDADDTPQVQKIVKKLKGASKAHADQAKSLEKELSDDIRNLPKDKQRALQHADKTAKPKKDVSLAPTPGIKTEETNLDEAFEEFFAEGMKVFFVSGSNAEGNVHAKNEKEAIAKAKKKGIKGKLTIRDKGKAVQPKFVESVNEGYEGEVKKVLDKKGIDAYFKNGKLMVSKRDKAIVIQILKRQDFDMPTIQVEEIQMEAKRFGLSVSLVDAVADVLAGKRPVEEKKKMKKDDDEDDKKAPVTDKDDDGKGMDPVGHEDGDIDNDGDKDKSDDYLKAKRKAIGKAMKGEKSGSKEPVDTKPKMDEGKQKKEDATPVDDNDPRYKDDPHLDKKPKPKSKGFTLGKHKSMSGRDSGQSNMGSVGVREAKLDELSPELLDRARDKADKKVDKAAKVSTALDKKYPNAPATPDDHPSRKGTEKDSPGEKRQQRAHDIYTRAKERSAKFNRGAVRAADRDASKNEDMTDAQMKRREEIVKELKKKSADFEERYGEKADDVMYATATKMAMKGK